MDYLDLEKIRQDQRRADKTATDRWTPQEIRKLIGEDVPALILEVERLRRIIAAHNLPVPKGEYTHESQLVIDHRADPEDRYRWRPK